MSSILKYPPGPGSHTLMPAVRSDSVCLILSFLPEIANTGQRVTAFYVCPEVNPNNRQYSQRLLNWRGTFTFGRTRQLLPRRPPIPPAAGGGLHSAASRFLDIASGHHPGVDPKLRRKVAVEKKVRSSERCDDRGLHWLPADQNALSDTSSTPPSGGTVYYAQPSAEAARPGPLFNSR